ncbi:hypothetical protein APB26_31430 [Pseudomonas aeruginosa]|uniref:hypothetical protein n=1 Tax=Pseudomonas aeruginosa TaxID=287 RepID=UPI00071BD713|nr:hypothetical protein [Pseudomonas aeruginosa]KSQ21502.1 hypothetical protein APB26_31430 [Pseudomonas aeruginosa]RPV61174.1 hypothetical protein IPC838_17760 [Pseudomonas aeruginosa]
MSLTTALETMMARNLAKHGYPTADISWSLGYCQGDGSSFTGSLDLNVLGPRLCPEVSADIWPSISCSLAIERLSSLRYVHEYSTRLNFDAQCIEETEAGEFGGLAQKVALHRLVGLLEADFVRVAQMNTSNGYKLQESYVQEEQCVWSFKTASFLVSVSKINDDDATPFLDDDLEYLDKDISDVIEGKISIFGSKVVISLLDADDEPSAVLAEHYTWGHCHDSDDAALRGLRRELVSEAIKVAREAYKKLLRPALKAA